jgi:hypothetical protein
MQPERFHLSDRELVLVIDGELPSRDAARVESHLAACWTCRARKQEFEQAIAGFVSVHQGQRVPPADGARARLAAKLSQIAPAQASGWLRWSRWQMAAAACVVLVAAGGAAWFLTEGRRDAEVAVAFPNPQLTPGATVLVGRGEVCRESNDKNKPVPASLQRRVFEAYGIPHARPAAYEVDYLITPALGGADDIRNLWPHSYRNTAWNAQVKDALEDYLRDLVCEGKVDLATAQQEIAANWIEAYKKYFNTDQPLPTSQ